MATETWYVLEDGAVADPRDVAPDKAGALRHKDGRAIARRGDVPLTRGVDPDQERAKVKPAKAKPDHAAKDMKPEDPAKGYRTRESKAE